MAIYFLQYFLIFFFSLLNSLKTKSKWIGIVIFLILFSIAAFRGIGIDRDNANYYKIFSKLVTGEYFSRNSYMYFEPAFYYIPAFFKSFFSHHFVEMSFVLYAFLGVFFKLRSFSISNSYFLSCLLYISSWYVLHEMTQIRAGVAVGILLCSIPYIYERRLIKFLLCVIAAGFFHYSSLIFIFAYLINPVKFSKSLNTIGIILGMIIAFLKIDFLYLLISIVDIPKLNDYKLQMAKGLYSEINVFNVLFIVNAIIAFLLIAYIDKLVSKNKYAIILTKLYVINIVIYLGLSSVPVLAMRLSEIFGAVQILLYPMLIYIFDKKIVGYLIVFFVFLLTSYNTFFVSKLLKEYHTWVVID